MALMRLLAPFCACVLLACGGDKRVERMVEEPPEEAIEILEPPPTAAAAAALVEEDEPETDGEIPEPQCPAAGERARNFDALLDLSATRLEALDFASAAACAEIAADLEPSSVEAHHMRASGLAALGRFAKAQVAFTMALALDPDDPQTLAATADFHINLLPPKTRASTLVGLEHARRGSARAVGRYRKNRPLRGRLALLEAQALNDLGRADEALERVNDAIRLAPRSVEARYERGAALFNLIRFEEAGAAFKAVLRLSPDDPYAHYHLGLIYERDGRDADAVAHFRRATRHPSGEFPPPVPISREDFRAEVDLAISELPGETAALLVGIPVETPDLPARDDLLAVDPPFAPTILGLYRGLPRGVSDPGGNAPERVILLYRKNLARAVKSRDELNRQIRRTLLHEIGHVAGLDEDQLRRRGLD